MRTLTIAIFIACSFGGALLQAAPPAPSFTVYGALRDDHGNPVPTSVGTVILTRQTSEEIVRSPSDTSLGTGLNYLLHVPMDSGTTSTPYKANAMFAAQ